jgi:SAM-dependent methyltransferase
MQMSVQYDALSGPYEEVRKKTISILERVNVREVVLPFIRGSTVLDLACGSGFYSRAFLRWGATSVIGVDISSGMLDHARALSLDEGSAVEFIEADCSKPQSFPGGPFDIVFGAWYLNYAANGKEMIDMYRNILLNLNPGGRYIGVTPRPTNDPRGFIKQECSVRPLPVASGGLYSSVNRDVEEGVNMHLHSATAAGDLDFDCFWLRRDIWEAAAKEAGFRGKLEWTTTKVPPDFMSNPEKYGEETNGGAHLEELETYERVPHYGILSIEK